MSRLGAVAKSKSIFLEEYDYFRKLLVQARVGAGLTQAQLAERLGRPQSYVSKFERGERRLDVVEFLAIADALDMDACEVIGQIRVRIRAPEGGKPVE